LPDIMSSELSDIIDRRQNGAFFNGNSHFPFDGHFKMLVQIACISS
jgi:hypothetical protein